MEHEDLKTMVDALIADSSTEELSATNNANAEAAFHNYLKSKMTAILNPPSENLPPADEITDTE